MSEPLTLSMEFVEALTEIINHKAPDLPEPKFTTCDVEGMIRWATYQTSKRSVVFKARQKPRRKKAGV